MNFPPLQLTIKCGDGEHAVTCAKLLRTIHNRRDVYEAQWQNKPVIVKIFYDKIFPGRHLKKEWKGFCALQSKGIDAPRPLFFGKTANGGRAMAIEKIQNSITVLEAFDKADSTEAGLKILLAVCKELAKQHQNGILQRDLHLGNFLLVRDRIYAIDPAQMEFRNHPVEKQDSIYQIAMLARYLPIEDTASIEKIYNEYITARKWSIEQTDMYLLNQSLTAEKKNAVKRTAKKCLRTGQRFFTIKTDTYRAVFDRSFCKEQQAAEFLKQIPRFAETGQILKDGHTCFVSRFGWMDRDIVAKRYNNKGFIYSLRHTIKGSRAKHCWVNAHILNTLQIATPRPLAFIEQRRGALVWQSYLITEFTEGQRLYDFFKENHDQNERAETVRLIDKLLEKLAKFRITHGDLKFTNILIKNNCLVLTDLDAMMIHKLSWIYKYHRSKDMKCFAQNRQKFKV